MLLGWSLSAPIRERIQFPLDHEERRDWSKVPHAIHPRRGVSMGELNAASRMKAHQLLRTALSSQGYLKATGIMAIEASTDIVPRGSYTESHALAQERERDSLWIESLSFRHLRRPAAGTRR